MSSLPKLNPLKVGASVRCLTCGRSKAPIGRSVPVMAADSYCTSQDCDGHGDVPNVSSLWPEESEEDFGYPVGDVGTEIKAPALQPKRKAATLGVKSEDFLLDLNEQLIPFLEYGERDSGTFGPYFEGGYSVKLDMSYYEVLPILDGQGEFMTKDGESFTYRYKLKSYVTETKIATFEVNFA